MIITTIKERGRFAVCS